VTGQKASGVDVVVGAGHNGRAADLLPARTMLRSFAALLRRWWAALEGSEA
jgi:hypothetical protein